MIRYNFYLTQEQKKFLEDLSQGTTPMSEHIRRAIDDYIKKFSMAGVSSASKRKEEEVNGK